MKLGSLIVTLLFSLVVLVNCSSEDASPRVIPCNENPWQCAANQTCWLNNASEYECKIQAFGVDPGDECLPLAGITTCGHNYICVQTVQQKKGICSKFCDPNDSNHACETGEVCSQVRISQASGTFHACAKTGTSGAGGAAGMSGMAGTAGAAGGETAGGAGTGGQAGMAGGG
jgi:hypothetical protein